MPGWNSRSVIIFFVSGLVLLLVPLTLILVWSGPACGLAEGQKSGEFCPTHQLFDTFVSLFPFLMVIGGVLIGYNLKRISDSLLPPKEADDGEDDGEEDPSDIEMFSPPSYHFGVPAQFI